MNTIAKLVLTSVIGAALSGCLQNIPKGEDGGNYAKLMEELKAQGAERGFAAQPTHPDHQWSADHR